MHCPKNGTASLGSDVTVFGEEFKDVFASWDIANMNSTFKATVSVSKKDKIR
jgi:hypothetical protein